MPPAPILQSSAAAVGGPSSDKPANTTTNNNEYEEALDKLQPLQPVLRGFNHRNRNQHRRAAWWAPFGMLRRHVDKLVDELFDGAAATAAKSKKNKKRKRGEDSSEDRAERKARGHVKWLRDVLVPKCYLAFSHLTADNQFATLGIVLLSALAQVNATCIQLIGEAVATTAEGDSSNLPTCELVDATGAGKESSSSINKELPPEMPSQKGGAVISRDEVARAEKLRRKNTQFKEGDQARSPNVPSSARKNADHDNDATPTEKQRGIVSKGKTKEIGNASSKEALKPPKKKKAKKGGDEFDNLFKGLF
ncbi:uncharacterized protein F4807DRAFT_412437 [Annulohypoxylon truncatum]|uniref:uncharacterized protein n=1 Tax=Annulohypoxylon truncatum TaxID=327061 RepID=UPI002007602B|nr:uncharacterized protein F4807DRAFT_412437 [Annulohypoxylon truncatum]KAI1212984.1 hypothetical protein F4807DRAFT_412437 [Annulohypoxylon truncatum]